MQAKLELGPVLRHVDTTTAAVWMKVSAAAHVTVRLSDGRAWEAPTFGVHGHHFALVELTGLEPGSSTEYGIEIYGSQVWPESSESHPSILRTLDDEPPVIAFGSCRTSVPHDAKGHLTHGVDALRTFGMAMARGKIPQDRWPQMLLLLGDQVYADELSDEMTEFISSRRDLGEPPGEELKDFGEYAHLYRIAWGEPWMRWVLSTLPSLMIFDDHDVRDDWNTSWQWRQMMEATSWWHGRIVAALASYWVYQHLGNLSVSERAEDEIWAELQKRRETSSEEVDLSDLLDEFAARVDAEPDTYRWSFSRDMGDMRLVVIDSRAARVLSEDERSMLDRREMRWLDEQLRGDCSHLLIGTSLPFMLPEGLHHLESWDEAVVSGAWGSAAAKFGERLREGMDLEHWAAFRRSFDEVAAMVLAVATGERGRAPRSISFLSGDVHHSYIAEVELSPGSRILQFVCSPIRNPLPRVLRAANVVASHRLAGLIGAPMARRADVDKPPFEWETLAGPWYDNNLAVMGLQGDTMRVSWWTGKMPTLDHSEPQLTPVTHFELHFPKPGAKPEPGRVLRRT